MLLTLLDSWTSLGRSSLDATPLDTSRTLLGSSLGLLGDLLPPLDEKSTRNGLVSRKRSTGLSCCGASKLAKTPRLSHELRLCDPAADVLGLSANVATSSSSSLESFGSAFGASNVS